MKSEHIAGFCQFSGCCWMFDTKWYFLQPHDTNVSLQKKKKRWILTAESSVEYIYSLHGQKSSNVCFGSILPCDVEPVWLTSINLIFHFINLNLDVRIQAEVLCNWHLKPLWQTHAACCVYTKRLATLTYFRKYWARRESVLHFIEVSAVGHHYKLQL